MNARLLPTQYGLRSWAHAVHARQLSTQVQAERGEQGAASAGRQGARRCVTHLLRAEHCNPRALEQGLRLLCGPVVTGGRCGRWNIHRGGSGCCCSRRSALSLLSSKLLPGCAVRGLLLLLLLLHRSAARHRRRWPSARSGNLPLQARGSAQQGRAGRQHPACPACLPACSARCSNQFVVGWGAGRESTPAMPMSHSSASLQTQESQEWQQRHRHDPLPAAAE